MHSDNNGADGGVADLIKGNHISDMNPGSFGVMVFAPYLPVTVSDNVITNTDVGLCASGQEADEGTPSFVNNSVDCKGRPGSAGVSVTTDLFGWGSANVAASFTGNDIKDAARGFDIEQEAGNTATVTASNNNICANGTGVYSNATATGVTLHDNNISGNTTSGVENDDPDAYTLDATLNWWGSNTGPSCTANSVSDGTGAVLTGTANFTPWLVDGNNYPPVTNPPTTTGFWPKTWETVTMDAGYDHDLQWEPAGRNGDGGDRHADRDLHGHGRERVHLLGRPPPRRRMPAATQCWR